MFVRVNGVQIGIEERGEARKSCLTLVMLHGFTGSAAGWGSHLETLAAYGWRVIALDLLVTVNPMLLMNHNYMRSNTASNISWRRYKSLE
jgi:hypothetical protein